MRHFPVRIDGIMTLMIAVFSLSVAIPTAHAAAITFRHKHFLFSIDPLQHPEWRSPREVWTYYGAPFDPPASWKVDGDALPLLPAGVQRTDVYSWNRAAIERTLESIVGKALNRRAGTVVIRRDEKQKIVFDGVGLPGRTVNIAAAAGLAMEALENNLTEITLPVEETQPQIRVDDPDLTDQGIREVITVGESDFSRSPVNRRFNIAVGLDKFNGTLIPAGGVFSFVDVLGPVNADTGFRRELVIKGDRTEPDYGGGLCQVSTTAYRGVWEYGFPILKRRNHSYTVSHYFPPGTDATVFPGSADMVFKNDSAHALLMQTYKEGDLAFFIYYGTRDARKTQLFGPFIYDRREPPADKTELTTDLPPGEKKKLNERVPGLKALWYRFVTSATGSTTMETVFSAYEARPLFTAIGVAELPPGYTLEGVGEPTFVEDITLPTMPTHPAAASSSSPTAVKPPSRRQ